jgi:hypothetical protein
MWLGREANGRSRSQNWLESGGHQSKGRPFAIHGSQVVGSRDRSRSARFARVSKGSNRLLKGSEREAPKGVRFAKDGQRRAFVSEINLFATS